MKALENFREKQGYNGKIEEISDVNELDQQLAKYIASMKQKNGEEYATSSVKASIAAFYRHLNKNSVIKHVNIYDTNIFITLSETASGKIKYLSDLGYGETKGSDGLNFSEIRQILSHKFMDGSTPERLLRWVFFHNAIILGLRGGEHSLIKANNFKKRNDGGFDVYIYRSKTNQRGLNDHGKAEILTIPNKVDVINDYESYFTKRPASADPQFYLQEYGEETGNFNSLAFIKYLLICNFIALQTGVWYKKSHVGETRLKGFMREICRLTEIDLKNRKISNHGGRKTMIQGLQTAGISREQVRLQSRHRTELGLNSYELPRDEERTNMMSKLATKMYDSSVNSGIIFIQICSLIFSIFSQF